jgi:hypothetical protein
LLPQLGLKKKLLSLSLQSFVVAEEDGWWSSEEGIFLQVLLVVSDQALFWILKSRRRCWRREMSAREWREQSEHREKTKTQTYRQGGF